MTAGDRDSGRGEPARSDGHSAESQLERSRAEIQRLLRRQRVLSARLQAAEQAAGQLRQLRTSALFRKMEAYRAAVERLAPPHSRRRRLYQRAVERVGRTQASTGPGAVGLPALPTSDTPEVSVVIPVHNHVLVTRSCLQSLAADPQAVPFEVVVVDDASDDETPLLLAGLVGGRVIRLETNRGFVGAANAGIAASRGRYVVLLNNDTLVGSGWLDELVETAEAWPDAGLVGAKLVYPDGRLQEAGGIVWSDATGWNYGRGQDPDDPRYNFVREVDYCSGACLLIRRGLLTALGGGLDERFAPAYYEDTDLAFAARKLGYRVLYQPAAAVCHVEGVSHGTDLSAGHKQFQDRNRGVFAEKWRTELAAQWTADPRNVRVASRRSPLGPLLVIDHWIPMPDHDSGSRRMYELLCLLSDLGFAVTFVPDDNEKRPQYSSPLERRGIEVLGGDVDLKDYLDEVGSTLRAAVLVRPPVAARHLPILRSMAPAAKVIYDTVDLHFLRARRQAALEGDASLHRAADELQSTELALVDDSDASFVVSPVERSLLLEERPHERIYVIPNIHRVAPSGPPFAEREGLLFVGGFGHPPNCDAVSWLVREVMPHVTKQLPDVRAHIVGSNPTDEIRELSGDNVEVLGWVPSLAYLYEQARVFVAPLRYGAGMKGKVGESLAHGLPVVTTRVGGEGMDLEHGYDVLVADEAADFAAAVVRLYTDEQLWERLASNGRRTIGDRFSPQAVCGLLVKALADVGLETESSCVTETWRADIWI